MAVISARTRKIIKASQISIFGNLFLSLVKIVAGFLAGSMALVADGIDSASDILASMITLFTARIISRPPDIKYPYGYDKADTVASKLVAFVIFFAGAQLAISTSQRLLEGKQPEMPSIIAIIIVLISIVGKQLLAKYLKRTGDQIDSPMLRANARNMQNDVVISASVLVGLVLTHVLKMPIIDSITALFVSIWIMVVAIRIIITSSRELMDGVNDPTIYRTISDAVAKVPDAKNPHRIRARKMAHYYMIALDVEVDGRKTLYEGHAIGHQVESNIRELIPNTYDVVVHVEPTGDENPEEAYGISGKDMSL